VNPYAAFLSLPGLTEFLILLFVIFFFLGPAVLAIFVRLTRGAEYEDPPETIRIPRRRRKK